MILVTVGTHTQGFDRLLRPMDALAGEIDEQVIIQRGSSSFEPEHAEHFQWTSGYQMEQFTRKARVVVSHAAAGAIIHTLQNDKIPIIAPRLKRFGEHVDDHQQQLAYALEAKGWAIVVRDLSIESLREAILAVENQNSIPNIRGPNSLVSALRQQLREWD